MSKLDPVIHQPVRLQIMAAVVELPRGDQVEFTYLKKLLKLTDGNLGAHLLKLEQAGYLDMEKTFVGRKPKTFIAVSKKGKRAFQDHVDALQEIIKTGKK